MSRRSVFWPKTAEQDLDAISDHILSDHPLVAIDIFQKIYQKVKKYPLLSNLRIKAVSFQNSSDMASSYTVNPTFKQQVPQISHDHRATIHSLSL
ncbi:MAG: hypothetical protein EXS67_04140 [Candidatus Margulisbacteria bacterium]|nr:hypothetical protein [Candidatus Margulisiibacteriota bacterium]